MLELNKIYNMDCLEGLKLLDDNSVDSIVTDPPYELGFMGKKWDNTGIAYNIDVWKECLKVLKPGGYILVAGIGRTHHRVMVSLEDAGFEIRDCIYHLFGSGFPKSMDISKAIDKAAGAEREIIGQKSSDPKRFKKWKETDGNERKTFNNDITLPATPEAKQWEGWGTALKPSAEIWILCRKPISEKTVAENVLKWGTGGINIDGCRIEYEESGDAASNPLYRKNNNYKINYGIDNNPSAYALKKEKGTMNINPQGRFPANVILDEEAGKMLDEQSGVSKSTTRPPTGKPLFAVDDENRAVKWNQNNVMDTTQRGYNDTGGASRFFKQVNYSEDEIEWANKFMYCAKASKKERGEGNNHPTVKPLSLMQYLVRLVTPPNGIVLDPFTGSGTTLLACIKENFNYIGFELDSNYYDLANKRIEEHKNKNIITSPK